MNIETRLINYITRYAPSHKKVLNYLIKKNREDAFLLLDSHGYNESVMCDMWIHSFVTLGKGKREIQQKLTKKEFPKDMILEKISHAEDDLCNWETNRIKIERKMEILLARGKSSQVISMTLSAKYPYFRDEIREYIESIDDTDSLKKDVQKYKNKYNLSIPNEKQKFYAALMRRGFKYSEIKEYISNNN